MRGGLRRDSLGEPSFLLGGDLFAHLRAHVVHAPIGRFRPPAHRLQERQRHLPHRHVHRLEIIEHLERRVHVALVATRLDERLEHRRASAPVVGDGPRCRLAGVDAARPASDRYRRSASDVSPHRAAAEMSDRSAEGVRTSLGGTRGRRARAAAAAAGSPRTGHSSSAGEGRRARPTIPPPTSRRSRRRNRPGRRRRYRWPHRRPRRRLRRRPPRNPPPRRPTRSPRPRPRRRRRPRMLVRTRSRRGVTCPSPLPSPSPWRRCTAPAPARNTWRDPGGVPCGACADVGSTPNSPVPPRSRRVPIRGGRARAARTRERPSTRGFGARVRRTRRGTAREPPSRVARSNRPPRRANCFTSSSMSSTRPASETTNQRVLTLIARTHAGFVHLPKSAYARSTARSPPRRPRNPRGDTR